VQTLRILLGLRLTQRLHHSSQRWHENYATQCASSQGWRVQQEPVLPG
jgi:hypothetical protein